VLPSKLYHLGQDVHLGVSDLEMGSFAILEDKIFHYHPLWVFLQMKDWLKR
jgi:hypothetical protein